MLNRLEIENFVFVDSANIQFGEGLNVFSGETGAGKSMIFRALAVALGEKASPSLVRVGAKSLRVALTFTKVQHPQVINVLTRLGVSEISNFTIQRVLTVDGKSRALVEEMPITVAELQALAPYLLDVHSQHQQQYLLDPNTHIFYFDAFASLKELRLKFEEAYRSWKEARDKLVALREVKTKARKEKDFLEFQFAELEAAAISKEEYENLKKQLAEFSSREARTNAYLKMHETLKGMIQEGVDELRQQLNTQLSRTILSAEDLEEMSSTKDKTDAMAIAVSEVLVSIEGKIEKFDFLRAIDTINQKLAKVEVLMRKQGISIDELWKKHNKISTALASLNEDDGEESELLAKLSVCERDAIKMALTLHVRRKEAIPHFEERVLEEIAYLGMSHSALKVFLLPKDLIDEVKEEKVDELTGKLTAYGLSKLEFLYSSAAERLPERLKKIISGGELSRLMLSLKIILSEKIPVNTMVFDEVDTGIGGEIASHVGEKLKQLSEKKQVVVITHLAQIARFANSHFVVDRDESNSSIVVVKELKNEEIKKEISRMLGGATFSSGGMLASEMLGDAKNN